MNPEVLVESCAVVFGPGSRATYRAIQLPPPGPGELLLRNVFSGVSPGTEMRCFTGTQVGLPSGEFIPGYTAAGVVELAGEDCRLLPGTSVYFSGTLHAPLPVVWGGHVAHAIVKEEAVLPLPEGFSLLDACLLKPAGIARRGVALSLPQPGEIVAVFGLGPIGQISARLHAAAGARVVGIDPDPGRRGLLEAQGIPCLAPGTDLREVTDELADIVVDATGVPDALASSIGAARELPWSESRGAGPRIVIQGSYPNDFRLLYDDLFRREAILLFPRDNTFEDIKAAMTACAEGRLTLGDLVSRRVRPEDAQSLYESFLNREPGLLTAAFDWSANG